MIPIDSHALKAQAYPPTITLCQEAIRGAWRAGLFLPVHHRNGSDEGAYGGCSPDGSSLQSRRRPPRALAVFNLIVLI
jgi:hypothetical protein